MKHAPFVQGFLPLRLSECVLLLSLQICFHDPDQLLWFNFDCLSVLDGLTSIRPKCNCFLPFLTFPLVKIRVQLTYKLTGHTDAVLAVNAHPTDPNRLVSGGAGLDKTVRLWQAEEPAEDSER